jgi:hypothetical protein
MIGTKSRVVAQAGVVRQSSRRASLAGGGGVVVGGGSVTGGGRRVRVAARRVCIVAAGVRRIRERVGSGDGACTARAGRASSLVLAVRARRAVTARAGGEGVRRREVIACGDSATGRTSRRRLLLSADGRVVRKLVRRGGGSAKAGALLRAWAKLSDEDSLRLWLRDPVLLNAALSVVAWL